MLAAAVALSAILMASALAFSVVQYAGAGYLIHLAVKALRSGDVRLEAASSGVSHRRALGQGVIGDIPNPETALFFLSFFPRFLRTGWRRPRWSILGLVFNVAAISSDLIQAVAADVDPPDPRPQQAGAAPPTTM